MWRVDYSAAALRDFELIFDHLFDAYIAFGDDPEEAISRATDRLDKIQNAAEGLGKVPYQGTLRDDLLAGVRFVRRDRAVFWFTLDEAGQGVRVLAVFYGGQDHIRHMLGRLLE